MGWQVPNEACTQFLNSLWGFKYECAIHFLAVVNNWTDFNFEYLLDTLAPGVGKFYFLLSYVIQTRSIGSAD